jgi:hypothetical protein
MKTSQANLSISFAGAALEPSGLAGGASLTTFQTASGLLSRAWRWMRARQMERLTTRRLRVAETVSLGDKRFVAVVQVDGRHFLLAGGPTNIALLAQLNGAEPFEDVLKKTMTVAEEPLTQPIVKQSPGEASRADVAAPPPLNTTEPLAGTLQKTMASVEKQPDKPAGRQADLRARPTNRPAAPLSNETKNPSDPLKKTRTLTGKKRAQRTSKQAAVAVAPANVPPRVAPNTAETFDQWLEGNMILSEQPSRTTLKRGAEGAGLADIPSRAPRDGAKTFDEWLQEMETAAEARPAKRRGRQAGKQQAGVAEVSQWAPLDKADSFERWTKESKHEKMPAPRASNSSAVPTVEEYA